MCIYYTYHWSCCPGTARPAPYYVHSMCDRAASFKPISSAGKNAPLKKCKVMHEILDGGESDQACPKCGYVTFFAGEDISDLHSTKPENCDQ